MGQHLDKASWACSRRRSLISRLARQVCGWPPRINGASMAASFCFDSCSDLRVFHSFLALNCPNQPNPPHPANVSNSTILHFSPEVS